MAKKPTFKERVETEAYDLVPRNVNPSKANREHYLREHDKQLKEDEAEMKEAKKSGDTVNPRVSREGA